MTYHIVIQDAATQASFPTPKEFKHWAKTVLQPKIPAAEITLRIVDKEEIRELNNRYRHKDKPTNVLSFPFEMLAGVKLKTPILGDIVICADIIKEEALAQHKTETAHWAHMVVHGILHLLGFDHENEADAEKMEQEEITILKSLGFPNPYQLTKKVSPNE